MSFQNPLKTHKNSILLNVRRLWGALITFFSLSLILSVPANAGCKVKAIFVQPPDEAPVKAVLAVNSKYVDIDLPQRNLSSAVELSAGDAPVAILPARPTQPNLPVGSPFFKVPAGWSQCILLFFMTPPTRSSLLE